MWWRRFVRALPAGAGKAIIAAAIMAFAMSVYLYSARAPTRPPIPTRTALDDLVPLIPVFAYVYVSPYVVAPLLAGFLPGAIFRRLLLRTAALLPFQLGAFFVVPTIVVRPPAPTGDTLGEPLLRHIYLVDTPPGNAAPSGHVSLAMIIAWAAWAALPRLRPATVAYFVLVAVSILFTGQHHVLDLVTGALLGGAVLYGVHRWERGRFLP